MIYITSWCDKLYKIIWCMISSNYKEWFDTNNTDIFKNTPQKNDFIKNNQVLSGILKLPWPHIFFVPRNFYSGPQKKFELRKKKKKKILIFYSERRFFLRPGFFFFFFRVWKILFFWNFCPTLHLWLTYQNTFKNHENLPTCILDFIE